MRNPQIQEVLSAMGVQMDELAKKIGWSYERLAEYATTPENVCSDIVFKIAEALNVDPIVFYNDYYKLLTKANR